jgi:hypothetical protein
MAKEESCISARVSVHLTGQSGDVSRVRPNLRSFLHELFCINWHELLLISAQINGSLLIIAGPESNAMNGLEFSIHNSEFSSFLSHPGITDYAEIMQSNANSRGFLDANQYKLNNMILYWNVGLLITDAPDAKNCQQQLMNAFPLITECLQYVFFAICFQLS